MTILNKLKNLSNIKINQNLLTRTTMRLICVTAQEFIPQSWDPRLQLHDTALLSERH